MRSSITPKNPMRGRGMRCLVRRFRRNASGPREV